MNFDWNPAKAASNLNKDNISFEIATEIFLDEYRVTIPDTRFNYGENRLITTGYIKSRLHVVVHTNEEDEIRLISARKANKREIKNHGNC